MSPTPSTVIFVSHSSKDKKSIRAIVDMIENNFQLVAEAIEEDNTTGIKFRSKTITEMICATCLSGGGLRPGDLIATAIRGHLKNARSIITLVTDNSFRSTFVTSELGGAWALRKNIKVVYGPNLSRGPLGQPLNEYHSIQWYDSKSWFQLIQPIIEDLIEELDKIGMIEHNLIEHNFGHLVHRAMDRKYGDILQNIEHMIEELEPSVFWRIWNNVRRSIYPIEIPLMIIMMMLLAVCSIYLYILLTQVHDLRHRFSMEPIGITMECGTTNSSSDLNSNETCRKIVEEWQKGFNQENDRKVSIAVLPIEGSSPLIRPDDKSPDPEKPSSIQEGEEALNLFLSAKSKRYDIIQFDVLWASFIAKAGSSQELEMQDKDQHEHFPSMIEAGKHEGILKAVPWSVDIGVLYYNNKLLMKLVEDSMIRLNDLSWNELSEFIEEAEKHSRVGFIWQSSKRENLTCTALEWISSFGENSSGESEWITKERDRELLDFSNQNVVKALTEAALLIYRTPSVFKSGNLLDLDGDRSINEFANDKKTLFMRHWLSQYAFIEKTSPTTDWFKVIPLPKNEKSGKRVGALGGLMIASIYQAEHGEDEKAEMVKKVVLGLAGERAQKIRMRYGFFPTMPKLFESIGQSKDDAASLVHMRRETPETINELSNILKSERKDNSRSFPVVRPTNAGPDNICHVKQKKTIRCNYIHVSAGLQDAIRHIQDAVRDIITTSNKQGITDQETIKPELEEKVRTILADLQKEIESKCGC